MPGVHSIFEVRNEQIVCLLAVSYVATVDMGVLCSIRGACAATVILVILINFGTSHRALALVAAAFAVDVVPTAHSQRLQILKQSWC